MPLALAEEEPEPPAASVLPVTWQWPRRAALRVRLFNLKFKLLDAGIIQVEGHGVVSSSIAHELDRDAVFKFRLAGGLGA